MSVENCLQCENVQVLFKQTLIFIVLLHRVFANSILSILQFINYINEKNDAD